MTDGFICQVSPSTGEGLEYVVDWGVRGQPGCPWPISWPWRCGRHGGRTSCSQRFSLLSRRYTAASLYSLGGFIKLLNVSRCCCSVMSFFTKRERLNSENLHAPHHLSIIYTEKQKNNVCVDKISWTVTKHHYIAKIEHLKGHSSNFVCQSK